MSTSTVQDVSTRLNRQQAVDQMVAAATKILAEQGPAQIQARSVAAAARVSTSAVYYHLGGLPELFQAIVDRGFADLSERFVAISPSGDPVADLFAMALTTREFAQKNPHLYDLMFGLSTRGSYRLLESEAPRARSDAFQSAYQHLVEAAANLITSGRVRESEDPAAIADQLWSCVHGFVTLELGGHFAHISDPIRQRLQPLTVNVFVGLGDIAERANHSHAATLRRIGPQS